MQERWSICEEPYYAVSVTGFTFRFREWLRRSEGLRKIQSDLNGLPKDGQLPGFVKPGHAVTCVCVAAEEQ